MRSARPSRLSPAQASSVASAAPSSSLLSRVSTLPRIGTTARSGRACRTCAWRRSDEVPTTAPAGSSAMRLALALMKASRTSSRGSRQRIARPAGSSVGMSFMECTAMSISPASSASSISLVKRPLPPASASGRSWMRSPVVLIARTSNVEPARAVRRLEPLAHLVRLRQRQRRPARTQSDCSKLARAVLPMLGGAARHRRHRARRLCLCPGAGANDAQ